MSRSTAPFTRACLTSSTTSALATSRMSPSAPSALKSTNRSIMHTQRFERVVGIAFSQDLNQERRNLLRFSQGTNMLSYLLQATQIKSNISRFSGFVWHENGEKQKIKVKEKLDKCVKEKLVEICDVLHIPIVKDNTSKLFVQHIKAVLPGLKVRINSIGCCCKRAC